MVPPGHVAQMHASPISKSETRNPKEIRMKAERQETAGTGDGDRAGRMLLGSFPLRASFGFRYSDFGFGLRANPAAWGVA
jgi:hypothetical protein